ncbi:D-alanyl-D-alanine carboxypeptidase, partial [Bacteroides sp. CAG:633]
MKRIILQACCLLLFSWLFAHRASAQQADSVATLASRIDTLLKYELPAGAHAGLCIYDLTAGRMLYEYQADKLSRPASTMKVMTAITALSQQGIDEPFRTELWTRGRIVGDTLKGDLYVVGGFDPELDETDLKELIGGLTKRGIRVLDGRIVGDVSMKDSLYWGT